MTKTIYSIKLNAKPIKPRYCGFFIVRSDLILYNGSMKEKVLQAIKDAGKPISSGEVAKILNADPKEVGKAFDQLKKEGAITSPIRCKWEAV